MRIFYTLALSVIFLPFKGAFSSSIEEDATFAAVTFATEAMDAIELSPIPSQCIEPSGPYSPEPLDPKFQARGADCSSFIGPSGYGPYGRELLKKFDELGEYSPLLLPQNDLGPACPRWKLLNLDERKNFWVNAFAAIAWAESACKKDAKAAGVHGTAMGLLQLNGSRSNRSWRGPDCDVSEILPAKNNLRCGVDIMNELMKEKEGVYKARGLFGKQSNSYWQELRRPQGGLIGERIKTFAPCFNK